MLATRSSGPGLAIGSHLASRSGGNGADALGASGACCCMTPSRLRKICISVVTSGHGGARVAVSLLHALMSGHSRRCSARPSKDSPTVS